MQDSIDKTVTLNAPVSRVWQALTDHEAFGSWFRVAIDGPFVVGEVSTGRMTYPGYEHFRWHAVVKAIEPERYFAFSWCPYSDDPDADYHKEPQTLVEFILAPNGPGTRLEIRESGFSALPDDPRRVDALRMNARGWEEQAANIAEYVGG